MDPAAQRKFLRIPAHHLVVHLRVGAATTAHYLADLSMGGMFVRGDDTHPVGATVEVALALPNSPDAVRLSGRVVNVTTRKAALTTGAPGGMGIEFVAPAGDAAERLAQLVRELGGPQAAAPLPAAASPQGPKEIGPSRAPSSSSPRGPTGVGPSVSPAGPAPAESSGDARLLTQIKGLLMELGEKQNALEAKDREIAELRHQLASAPAAPPPPPPAPPPEPDPELPALRAEVSRLRAEQFQHEDRIARIAREHRDATDALQQVTAEKEDLERALSEQTLKTALEIERLRKEHQGRVNEVRGELEAAHRKTRDAEAAAKEAQKPPPPVPPDFDALLPRPAPSGRAAPVYAAPAALIAPPSGAAGGPADSDWAAAIGGGPAPSGAAEPGAVKPTVVRAARSPTAAAAPLASPQGPTQVGASGPTPPLDEIDDLQKTMVERLAPVSQGPPAAPLVHDDEDDDDLPDTVVRRIVLPDDLVHGAKDERHEKPAAKSEDVDLDRRQGDDAEDVDLSPEPVGVDPGVRAAPPAAATQVPAERPADVAAADAKTAALEVFQKRLTAGDRLTPTPKFYDQVSVDPVSTLVCSWVERAGTFAELKERASGRLPEGRLVEMLFDFFLREVVKFE